MDQFPTGADVSTYGQMGFQDASAFINAPGQMRPQLPSGAGVASAASNLFSGLPTPYYDHPSTSQPPFYAQGFNSQPNGYFMPMNQAAAADDLSAATAQPSMVGQEQTAGNTFRFEHYIPAGVPNGETDWVNRDELPATLHIQTHTGTSTQTGPVGVSSVPLPTPAISSVSESDYAAGAYERTMDEPAVHVLSDDEDDPYDVMEDDDDDLDLLDAPGMALSLAPPTNAQRQATANLSVVMAIQAAQDDENSRIRTYHSVIGRSPTEHLLTSYFPSMKDSPLRDPVGAKIFCHFVNVIGPGISMFERHPANPSLVFQGHPVPQAQRHIWSCMPPFPYAQLILTKTIKILCRLLPSGAQLSFMQCWQWLACTLQSSKAVRSLYP
jgi:hypothetical protein